MPWSYPTNVPSFAENKSEEIQKLAVKVANESLSKTNDEDSATFAAIAAVKKFSSQDKASKSSQVAFKRSTPSHIPAVVEKAAVEPINPVSEDSSNRLPISREFLGKNALPVGKDRNLVSVELKDNFQLYHTFDTGERIITDLSSLEGTIENYVSISNPQGSGSIVNSFSAYVETLADVPLIVEHNLNLSDPEALFISTYLNGRMVDVEVQILDANSIEIMTFMDLTDLKINILGI